MGTSDFWNRNVRSPNSECWNLKFRFKMTAKKNHEQNSNLSVNKNYPTKLKMADKKLIKPSPNIIVTWKVTIPFKFILIL